jgi:hypothetical protein
VTDKPKPDGKPRNDALIVVELTQSKLRESIEETKRLADDAEALINRARNPQPPQS